MTEKILFLPIIIPLIGGILALVSFKSRRFFLEKISFLVILGNLVLAGMIFKHNLQLDIPWAGLNLEFSLRLYNFSAFILLASAFFGFLVTLYSFSFMRDKQYANQFYAYLLFSLAFVNGAVLADNLILMLFFWEGLLLTLFGMIAIGKKEAFKTAAKAFIIVGISDLCLMLGIALIIHLSGTAQTSAIHLPLNTLGSIAFILLMIGAISKAGSMPFHSWIPDAALDAPLPFMAFMPASLEKLLGIYFLSRITLDLFVLSVNSWVSILLMAIGAITIILAVMMALVQKDYKRLLSYHAISQVGYMILGIGTAVPAGIIGGIFHMINNALYKSGLFLTGGAVEKQAGTTSLEKLGGLARKMPITFICFIITAASISGMPPFNGFFSKELIYDGALERGLIFYLAAIAGSFLTAASFLKLGHAAFLGKLSDENKNIREVPLGMLLPMITIAVVCVIFGIFNVLPIKILIQPILGTERIDGHNFSGWPTNMILVVITVIVLLGAYLNHLFGVKKSGSGLHASDHFRYAPVLSKIYDLAERRFFDPYDLGLKFSQLIAGISWRIDRIIDWVYDNFSVKLVYAASRQIMALSSENYSFYIAWSLLGMVLVFVMFFIY